MTWLRATAASFRLLLIFVLAGNAFAFDEGQCEGTNLRSLVGLLATSEMQEIKGQIESVVLLNKLVQSSSKCNSLMTLQSTKMAKIEDSIRVLLAAQNQDTKEQLQQIAKNLLKLQTSQSQNTVQQKELVTKINYVDSTLGKIEKALEVVTTTVHANEHTIKRVECQKLMQFKDINRRNLILVGDQSFYYNKTHVNYYEAREYCSDRWMKQATVKSLSQLDKASAAIKNLGFDSQKANNFLWTSASDIDQTAGQFVWSDRTPVDIKTWFSNEPNEFGRGNDTCVFLDTAKSRLRDIGCSSKECHALCEVPKELLYCFDRLE